MFHERNTIMNKNNAEYQIIDQIVKAIEQDKLPFVIEEFRLAKADERADVFLRIKKIKPFIAATVMRNLRTSTLLDSTHKCIFLNFIIASTIVTCAK